MTDEEPESAARIGWEELTKGRPFVTDLGHQPDYVQRMPEGPPMLMGQYAVFLPLPEDDRRHQIVEVSHDLEHLKKKYGVADDAVLSVTTAKR